MPALDRQANVGYSMFVKLDSLAFTQYKTHVNRFLHLYKQAEDNSSTPNETAVLDSIMQTYRIYTFMFESYFAMVETDSFLVSQFEVE